MPTVTVPINDLYNITKLTTDFDTEASYNSEYNNTFGRSEQSDNIRNQCKNAVQQGNNFFPVKFNPGVITDSIKLEDVEFKINGILRLPWTTQADDIGVIDDIDDDIDVDDVDLDDIDLELFYGIDVKDVINKEEFKELLRNSGVNINEKLVNKLFAYFDKDNNESLDYEEVSKFINYVKQKRTTKLISKTEKINEIVNIDTRYRDNYFKNTSSSFTYKLPEPQLDVTNIRVGNVDIPMAQYTVSSKLENNSFLITSDANTIKITSDVSSHWRLQMQIGDISSDWLHGTVFEDLRYTSTDISNANSFASGTPNHYDFWHGPEFSTTNVYDTSIVPVEIVTFEATNNSFNGTSNYYENDEPISGTMLDFYADLSQNDCGLGNPAKERILFPRSRMVPLEEQSISNYIQPPGDEYWGDPWGAFANETILRPILFPPDSLSRDYSNTINEGNDGNYVRYWLPEEDPSETSIFAKTPYPKDTSGNIRWGWLKPKFPFRIHQSDLLSFNGQFLNQNYAVVQNTYDVSVGQSTHRTHQHPNGSRSLTLPEYDVSHQQLIFPDPSYVPFGHVPYTKTCTNKIQISNYTKTTTKTETYKKQYTFMKLTHQQWQASNGIWNGQDENYSANETVDETTNPYYNEPGAGNDATYASRKWLLHSEVNYKELVKDQTTLKPINAWFPRGNPNRTDISFDKVKYYDGTAVEYPYDCSGIHETSSETNVMKEINLYSFTYIRLRDGKEITSSEFMPIKFAWLVTLPDGNYDEIWTKIHRAERIVNDAISVSRPGAVNSRGDFAAIKYPEHYLYLNNNKFNKLQTFSTINLSQDISNFKLSDIRYTIDRITKKSVFSNASSFTKDASGNIVKINSMKTKSFKFLQRTGQSSLRTVDETFNPSNPSAAQPSGEQYREMVLLQNVAKQHKTASLGQLPSKLLSTIKFNIDNYGNEDNETNIQNKLGWVLGFRTAECIL